MASLKMLKTRVLNTSSFHKNDGMKEIYTYVCPCGCGVVKEAHVQTPDKVMHRVLICCEKCSQKFYMSGTGDLRNWRLLPKSELGEAAEKAPMTPEEKEIYDREVAKIARRTGRVLDWPETADWGE